MPSIAIHLAVAKKYLEKHTYENINDFISGTIAPDIGLDNINDYINGKLIDKNTRHFDLNYLVENVTHYIDRKIDFNNFFKNNDLTSSFIRGYFLHLLCDHYFFDINISSSKLTNLSFEDSIKIIYNDYDLINPIIIEKYNLSIPKEVKDIMSRKGHGKLQLLDLKNIDKFINKMSNLDLYNEKIKLSKKIVPTI